MANSWTIKGKRKVEDVEQIVDIAVVKELEYHGEWMGDEFVTVTVKSEVPVEFRYGDYLTYRGETFVIDYEPNFNKKARKESYGEAFTYENIKLYTLARQLRTIAFKDYVLNWDSDSNKNVYSSQDKFSFFAASVEDLADRIQANLDRTGQRWYVMTPSNTRTNQRSGNNGWGSYYTGNEPTGFTDVNITCDSIKCDAALKMAYDNFGLSYIIKDRTIIIGSKSTAPIKMFEYGKGKGLAEIEGSTDESQEVVTRLYAYGSEKNMPRNFYANMFKKPYMKGMKATAPSQIAGEGDDYFIKTSITYSSAKGAIRNLTIPSVILTNSTGSISCVAYVVDYVNDGSDVHYLQANLIKSSHYAWIKGQKVYGNAENFYASVSNNEKLYITYGIDTNIWPDSYVEKTGNYPAMLSVLNLMMPGFPKQSLDAWVLSKIAESTGDERNYWQGIYDKYDFSDDVKSPWVQSKNAASLGVREGTVYFDGSNEVDEIFPTIEGTGADVVTVGSDVEDNGYLSDENESLKKFTIDVARSILDWDEAYSSRTEDVVVSMKDGYNAGRNFKLQSVGKDAEYEDNPWKLTLEREQDTSIGRYFPYFEDARSGYCQVMAGNHFVVTGIELPESYVDAAAVRLLLAALQALDEVDHVRKTLLPKIDEIYMQREHDAAATGTSLHDRLKPGLLLGIGDDDVIEDKEDASYEKNNLSSYIDHVTIKENGNNGIPTYDVVLRDRKEEDFRTSIEKKIVSISGGSVNVKGGLTIGQVTEVTDELYPMKKDAYKTYLSIDFFNHVFEVHGKKTYDSGEADPETGEPIMVTEDITVSPNEWPVSTAEVTYTITDIEAKYGLWTNYFISALGKNSDGSGGAVRLFDLVDVQIPETPTAANDGQALVYDSTLGKWTNKTVGGGGASLNEPLAGINSAALGTPSETGMAIVWNGSTWSYQKTSAGSVTSVGLTAPTGFVVNGTPVTSSGTLGLAFADGYSLPTTEKQGQWDSAFNAMHTHSNKSVLDKITSTKVSNWDKAFGWGDHAAAGYALAANVYTKADADAKFMTIAAFERLFNPLNSSDQKVSHPYSSGVASIKALFGLWTEQYLSALGKNDSGGGSVVLNGPLDEINNTIFQTTHPTSAGKTIVWNGSAWVYGTAGSGSVTSVGMTVPTGFSVSPSSITSSGTFAVSFASGYSLPTTAKQSNWDTAYSWVNTNSTNVAMKDWVNQNYISIAFFNRIFQAYKSSTISDANKLLPNDVTSAIDNLKIMVGAWTEQYLSALGKNDDSGSTVLNALLESLNESGLGAHGSANTTVVWNGSAWVFGTTGLDQTELTNYLSTKILTLKNGQTTLGTYNPTAASTIDLASVLNGYVTELGTNGNYLTWTKNGVTNNITVPYATNADKLDGAHGSEFYSLSNNNVTAIASGDDLNDYTTAGTFNTTGGNQGSSVASSLLNKPSFGGGFRLYVTALDPTSKYISQRIVTYSGKVFDRFSGSISSDNPWDGSVWRELAYTDSNVASASKLNDNGAYTAWGKTFFVNGVPQSISNTNMTGVTNIDSLLYFDTTNNRVGIGASSPSFKLDVNGDARIANKLYLYKHASDSAKDVYLEYVDGNKGVHLVGGGLYADTYISALGLSDSGGTAFDEDAMWQALGTTISQKQISSTYLSNALAPYALTSQIPTALKNPYALTITLNGTATSYDGSEAKSLTISTGLDTAAADARYLKLDGTNTMTGVLTVKASQYTDGYTGALNMANSNIYGVNGIYTSDLANNASEGINFYRDETHVDSLWVKNGVMYFTPDRELGTGGTSNTVLHTGNYTTTLDARYVTLSTAQRITGEKKFNYSYGMVMDRDTSNYKNISRVFASDGTTQIAYIGYINVTQRMFLSAQDNTDPWSDAIGKYQLKIGVDELTYNTYSILHAGNTYVSSGKGYINGTEITTISGNAATASRLIGTGTYSVWGQTYWQNGVPQSVIGDIRMLPSGGNTNSDSAKIDFRTLADNNENVYGPYIQAINVSSYGRKRLSVFQKNDADWTTAQTEVFTIMPNGTVGIATSTPNTNYKLDVAGHAKAGRLYLSDSIYMVVENNGVHIVGGGLYADTYVSALGLSDSGGSAFDEEAMWIALGTTITAKNIALAYIQTAADTRYALKTDIPTLSNLSWSYGSVTAASGNSYNGSTARSFVIPSATSHLTNDSGFITQTTANSNYVTALGVSGDYITWTKNGSANNLTVPYATHATRLAQSDLANGASVGGFVHSSDLIYVAKGGGNGCTDIPDVSSFGLISLKTASGYYGQMLLSGGGTLYVRSSNSLEGVAWKKILDSSNWTSTINLASLGAASASDVTTLQSYFTNGIANNADKLDGKHLNELFTALTSTNDTNLSVTVGGVTKTIDGLFALRMKGVKVLSDNSYGDLNLLDGTSYSVITNYHNNTRWLNSPFNSGSSYGGAVVFRGTDASLMGQLMWNARSDEQKSPTRYLWWRARANTGWKNDWRSIALGDTDGNIYMLTSASGTSVNSNSAKLKFNSLYIDGFDVQVGDTTVEGQYRSPYIQAIYQNNYGRKRLSVFQSNAANYTDPFNEVLTIMPNGTVGINTSSPNTNYKLDVAGYAKAGRLYLSDTIYLTVQNDGVHVVGGGLYADTYVSALGLSNSSDPAFDETAMWAALARNGNDQINVSHLTTALSPYALTSQIPTALPNPNALNITLNGTVISYDGSAARSMTINTGLDQAALEDYLSDKTLTMKDAQNRTIGSWTPTAAGDITVDLSVLRNLYTSRPTSANVEFSDGGLRVFKATSSMTNAEGRPNHDAHIIHAAWDTSAGWNAQLALFTSGQGMRYRGQSNHNWGDWKVVLDSDNSGITNSTIKINGTSLEVWSTANFAPTDYVALTGAQTISGVKTFSSQQKFTVAQGTSPFTVTSTTKVTNLNADLLDGFTSADFLNRYTSSKELSGVGWYRVAQISSYGGTILLSLGAVFNHAVQVPHTMILSVSYYSSSVKQLTRGCKNSSGNPVVGHISNVRLVKYGSGKYYVDVYYNNSDSNTEYVSIGWLSRYTSTNITMVDWTPVESLASGETESWNEELTYLFKSDALQTSRTLWGQTFDGTANVSGNMTGVGSIDASGNISVTKSTTADAFVSVTNNNGSIMLYTSSNRGVYDNTTGKKGWLIATNGTNTFLSRGNVGIGKTSPEYKLDVNGAARVSELWIGGVRIIHDSTNGGLRVVSSGLYADTYVSALGVGDVGGGGGTDLETVWTSMAENDSSHTIHVSHIQSALSSYLTTNNYATQTWVSGRGYATQTWVNQQGFIKSAGVTSIGMNVPTGLKVNGGVSATISSTGTFDLTFENGYSIPTDSSQGNWDIAYTNNHTHSNKSVLDGITSTFVTNWNTAYTNNHTHSNKSVLDGITAAKVSHWDTAYDWGDHSSQISTLQGYFDSSGSANSAVKLKTARTINGTSFDGTKNITTANWGTARNISISDADATNTGSAVSVNGSAAVTLKLPSTIKASLSGNATTATTASKLSTVSKTAWGQTYWTSGGIPTNISGSLSNVGNISSTGGYVSGFYGIDFNGVSGSGAHGGFLDFHYAGSDDDYTSRIIESDAGTLSFVCDYSYYPRYEFGLGDRTSMLVGSSDGSYVQVGDIRMVYDSYNNAIRIETSTGGAANLYAMGGISALGMSGNADGTISGSLIPSTSKTYTLGNSSYRWKYLYLSYGSDNFSIEPGGGQVAFNTNTGFYFNSDTEIGGDLYVNDHLGVGDTDASYALYVYGNAKITGGLSYNSDMRLKDFLANKDIDVENIARAPLFDFRWKDTHIDNDIHIGTSAQYWRGVLSETVNADSAGMLSLDYGVTALAGVISVARKVMTHEERIKALEEENERLRNEVEQLKAA